MRAASTASALPLALGTADRYDFSPALREMEIVWTSETVAKLFKLRPSGYMPGTKMPAQRIGGRRIGRRWWTFRPIEWDEPG